MSTGITSSGLLSELVDGLILLWDSSLLVVSGTITISMSSSSGMHDDGIDLWIDLEIDLDVSLALVDSSGSLSRDYWMSWSTSSDILYVPSDLRLAVPNDIGEDESPLVDSDVYIFDDVLWPSFVSGTLSAGCIYKDVIVSVVCEDHIMIRRVVWNDDDVSFIVIQWQWSVCSIPSEKY